MPEHQTDRRPEQARPTPESPVAQTPASETDVTVGAAVGGIAVRRRGADTRDPLGGAPMTQDLSATLARRSGGGRPLPADIASSFGEAFGTDLSGVRVHDDGEADGIARSVQSVAFTHGDDLYFTHGSYSPGGDDHVLAHELAHVVQQRAGRHTSPATAGTIGRADDPAEAEADRMAGEALSGLRRLATHTEAASAAPGSASIRRKRSRSQSIGVGPMFDDEEKRAERAERKSGGLTDDSVAGVGAMFDAEEKIAEKRDERRKRKQRPGGITLGTAGDVAEFFDLQDRDWFTDQVEANPETPKKYLPVGTEIFTLNAGAPVSAGNLTNGFLAEIKKTNQAQWSMFEAGGTTYVVKTADLQEDPALSHVRDDAPVFPLDAKGDPIPPKPEDVKQYGLGDCYLEAALASVAATSPGQIMEMVKDYGNTATVRLYEVQRDKVKKDQADPGEYKANTAATFTPKLIRVEKSRVRKGDKLQYDAGALWVGIIEKAYTAGRFGGTEEDTDKARQPGQNANYGSIEGGFSRYAWEVLLGRPSLQFDVTQGEEQGALGRKDMPWSPAEVAEHKRSATRFFGASYTGLVSYQIYEMNKKKVDAWMKWLRGKGQPAIAKLFTDLAAEKAGGYEHGTIRLEDFELVFADNGLSTELATPMLAYLEGYFPGKRGSGKYTRDQLRLWHQIQKAMNDGILVGVDTHQKVGRSASGVGASGGEAMTKGLAGGHAYSLVGTATVGDLKFVKIRNPWGQYSRDYDVTGGPDGSTKLSPKEVQNGDGVSMLELSDLTKRFFKINFS
ncbi:DUF4157 domain-containing protein [Nocardioides sp. YIM 152315]|uniref:eCIS core domain-containing protein n=1 Tax=Nocardioides sp. YIM 152315 TaxID=3031760 RepID=UPI0023DAE3F9|nr:DUF4157 domain-containing protein [Nocardioides sp. YIM 152315]MDF1604187.1 DUF4157 domain-containing protein [Nocardioides sp. YIM 152315]